MDNIGTLQNESNGNGTAFLQGQLFILIKLMLKWKTGSSRPHL